MSGITELSQLLSSMKPEIADGEFVFCTVNDELKNYLQLQPKAVFQEVEGLTLVLAQANAEQAGLEYHGVFKQLTLTVHSSLDAVGLTAAVSSQLAKAGISANVIAAYYHDHIFVPKDKASQALLELKALSNT